jgi:hypothetical protein
MVPKVKGIHLDSIQALKGRKQADEQMKVVGLISLGVGWVGLHIVANVN